MSNRAGVQSKVNWSIEHLISCVEPCDFHFRRLWSYFENSGESGLEFVISNTTESGIRIRFKIFQSDANFKKLFPETQPAISSSSIQPFSKRSWKRFDSFCLANWLKITVENSRMHPFLPAIFGPLPAEIFKIGWSQIMIFCNTLVESDCPGFPKGAMDDLRKKPAFRMNWQWGRALSSLGIEGPEKGEELISNGSGRFECKLFADFPLTEPWKCGF